MNDSPLLDELPLGLNSAAVVVDWDVSSLIDVFHLHGHFDEGDVEGERVSLVFRDELIRRIEEEYGRLAEEEEKVRQLSE